MRFSCDITNDGCTVGTIDGRVYHGLWYIGCMVGALAVWWAALAV